MMLKSRLLLGFIFIISVFAACEKPEPYDPAAQYTIDEARIKRWADSTNTVLTKHESGLYYKIDTPGTGDAVDLESMLVVDYEGRLLTDSVFAGTTDAQPYTFLLKNSIPGWKLGLPLIRKGGQIQLLIPSTLAYRGQVVGEVPANSPLHFVVRIREE